jgi:hypothetical protein
LFFYNLTLYKIKCQELFLKKFQPILEWGVTLWLLTLLPEYLIIGLYLFIKT